MQDCKGCGILRLTCLVGGEPVSSIVWESAAFENFLFAWGENITVAVAPVSGGFPETKLLFKDEVR